MKNIQQPSVIGPNKAADRASLQVRRVIIVARRCAFQTDRAARRVEQKSSGRQIVVRLGREKAAQMVLHSHPIVESCSSFSSSNLDSQCKLSPGVCRTRLTNSVTATSL